HNGGTVQFGPDGMLYVGTGDGGGSCDDDQQGGAQDVDALFGKILRLNPKNPPTYAASGNPFATGGDPRVLHYGLRNPFRFNVARATADRYTGDAGQGRYEEINYAANGHQALHAGWAAYEGADMTCGDRPFAVGSTHHLPLIEIDRRDMGSASVIGGVVYRGSAIAKLQGVYLYADYYGPHLSAVRPCKGQLSER